MGGSVDKAKKDLGNAANDINYTLDNVRNGNSAALQGAASLVGKHASYAYTAGLVDVGGALGIKSPSGAKADAEAIRNQAMYDENIMNDQLTADRVNKVTNRLNEAVKLRQKQPGRAQTLLTSTLTGPNSGNPDTLLTSVAKG